MNGEQDGVTPRPNPRPGLVTYQITVDRLHLGEPGDRDSDQVLCIAVEVASEFVQDRSNTLTPITLQAQVKAALMAACPTVGY